MTTTLTPVLDAVTVPADEPAAAPAQASDPTAGCAVLTLAVLTVAVTDPKHPMWAAAALALTAVTVGWAGRSAFGTAWTALRGGGLAAESLTAAGLLAMLVGARRHRPARPDRPDPGGRRGRGRDAALCR